MIDAENAAQLWLESHEPMEWRQLLSDFEKTPKLPDEAVGWPRGSSPEMRMQLDELSRKHGISAAEVLTRFEQTFIDRVCEATERFGKQ
jgi:hypothetical protein